MGRTVRTAAAALTAAVLLQALGATQGQGNCTGTSDFTFWEQEGFAQSVGLLELCGRECKALRPECEICVDREFDDYTEACQECWVDLLACPVTGGCAGVCVSSIFGSTSPECAACVVANCNPNFLVCAGFPLAECATCIVPVEEEDLTPIIVGAAFGGLVVIAVATLGIKWALKPPLTDAEKLALVEKRIHNLGISEISIMKSPDGAIDKLAKQAGIDVSPNAPAAADPAPPSDTPVF